MKVELVYMDRKPRHIDGVNSQKEVYNEIYRNASYVHYDEDGNLEIRYIDTFSPSNILRTVVIDKNKYKLLLFNAY